MRDTDMKIRILSRYGLRLRRFAKYDLKIIVTWRHQDMFFEILNKIKTF